MNQEVKDYFIQQINLHGIRSLRINDFETKEAVDQYIELCKVMEEIAWGKQDETD